MRINTTTFRNVFVRQDYIFLIVSLFFTLCFALNTSLYTVPDEAAHYLRAYEVSRGHLINSKERNGTKIGCSEYISVAENSLGQPTIAYHQKISLEDAERPDCYLLSINSANIYSAFPYTFSSLGMLFSEMIGLSDSYSKRIAGRILNGIAVSLIVFWGFRPTHPSKYALIFIYFLPGTLVQVGSLSADSLTYALLFRMTFTVIDALADRKSPKLIELSLLGLFLGFSKSSHCLFAAISILFFNRRDGTRGVSIVILPIIASLVAAWVTLPSITPYLGHSANPTSQLQHILAHPFDTFVILTSAISQSAKDLIAQLISPLPVEWISPYAVYFGLAYIVLCMVCFPSFPTYTRIAATAFILAFALVPTLSMYLVYNPVGSDSVLGIQGRYFLPCILLFPLVFSGIIATRYNTYLVHCFGLCFSPALSIYWLATGIS